MSSRKTKDKDRSSRSDRITEGLMKVAPTSTRTVDERQMLRRGESDDYYNPAVTLGPSAGPNYVQSPTHYAPQGPAQQYPGHMGGGSYGGAAPGQGGASGQHNGGGGNVGHGGYTGGGPIYHAGYGEPAPAHYTSHSGVARPPATDQQQGYYNALAGSYSQPPLQHSASYGGGALPTSTFHGPSTQAPSGYPATLQHSATYGAPAPLNAFPNSGYQHPVPTQNAKPPRRDSTSSSSSSSYVDISRQYPIPPVKKNPLGALRTFFTAPSESRRRVIRRKSSRTLLAQRQQGKKVSGRRSSSSEGSSVDSDLAYGTGYLRRRRSRRRGSRGSRSPRRYGGSPGRNGRYSPGRRYSPSREGRDRENTRPAGGVPLPGLHHSGTMPGGFPIEAGVVAAGSAAIAAGLSSSSKSKPSKPSKQSKRDAEAEILKLGEDLHNLAKKQNRYDLEEAAKKGKYNVVRDDNRLGRHGYGPKAMSGGQSPVRGIPSSKPTKPKKEDDGWETSDSDDTSSSESVDDALGYGDTGSYSWKWREPNHPPRTSRQNSQLPSHSQSNDRRPDQHYPHPPTRKSTIVDPKLFGPQNSLLGLIERPVGFGSVDDLRTDGATPLDPPTVKMTGYFMSPMPSPKPITRDVEDTRSKDAQKKARAPSPARKERRDGEMQHVFPIPTSDPGQFDITRGSVSTPSHIGNTEKRPSFHARTDSLPLRQPKPMSSVRREVFDSPSPALERHTTKISKTYEEDKKDKDKDKDGRGEKSSRSNDLALGGLAGAALAAAIAADMSSPEIERHVSKSKSKDKEKGKARDGDVEEQPIDSQRMFKDDMARRNGRRPDHIPSRDSYGFGVAGGGAGQPVSAISSGTTIDVATARDGAGKVDPFQYQVDKWEDEQSIRGTEESFSDRKGKKPVVAAHERIAARAAGQHRDSGSSTPRKFVDDIARDRQREQEYQEALYSSSPEILRRGDSGVNRPLERTDPGRVREPVEPWPLHERIAARAAESNLDTGRSSPTRQKLDEEAERRIAEVLAKWAPKGSSFRRSVEDVEVRRVEVNEPAMDNLAIGESIERGRTPAITTVERKPRWAVERDVSPMPPSRVPMEYSPEVMMEKGKGRADSPPRWQSESPDLKRAKETEGSNYAPPMVRTASDADHRYANMHDDYFGSKPSASYEPRELRTKERRRGRSRTRLPSEEERGRGRSRSRSAVRERSPSPISREFEIREARSPLNKSVRDGSPVDVYDAKFDRDRKYTVDDAQHIMEEIDHFTAPIPADAIGAAIAAVHNDEDRHRGDVYHAHYDSQGREIPRDKVQEEADRYYREMELARKLAKQHDNDPTPRVVTPPAMEHHHESPTDESKKYGVPNADFEFDHTMTPDELPLFSPVALRKSFSLPERFDDRVGFDPKMVGLERPILNLVMATPRPEEQVGKVGEPSSREQSRECKESSRSVPEDDDKPSYGKPVGIEEDPDEPINAYAEIPTITEPEKEDKDEKSVSWGADDIQHYVPITPYDEPRNPHDSSIPSSPETTRSTPTSGGLPHSHAHEHHKEESDREAASPKSRDKDKGKGKEKDGKEGTSEKRPKPKSLWSKFTPDLASRIRQREELAYNLANASTIGFADGDEGREVPRDEVEELALARGTLFKDPELEVGEAFEYRGIVVEPEPPRKHKKKSRKHRDVVVDQDWEEERGRNHRDRTVSPPPVGPKPLTSDVGVRMPGSFEEDDREVAFARPRGVSPQESDVSTVIYHQPSELSDSAGIATGFNTAVQSMIGGATELDDVQLDLNRGMTDESFVNVEQPAGSSNESFVVVEEAPTPAEVREDETMVVTVEPAGEPTESFAVIDSHGAPHSEETQPLIPDVKPSLARTFTEDTEGFVTPLEEIMTPFDASIEDIQAPQVEAAPLEARLPVVDTSFDPSVEESNREIDAPSISTEPSFEVVDTPAAAVETRLPETSTETETSSSSKSNKKKKKGKKGAAAETPLDGSSTPLDEKKEEDIPLGDTSMSEETKHECKIAEVLLEDAVPVVESAEFPTSKEIAQEIGEEDKGGDEGSTEIVVDLATPAVEEDKRDAPLQGEHTSTATPPAHSAEVIASEITEPSSKNESSSAPTSHDSITTTTTGDVARDEKESDPSVETGGLDGAGVAGAGLPTLETISDSLQTEDKKEKKEKKGKKSKGMDSDFAAVALAGTVAAVAGIANALIPSSKDSKSESKDDTKDSSKDEVKETKKVENVMDELKDEAKKAEDVMEEKRRELEKQFLEEEMPPGLNAKQRKAWKKKQDKAFLEAWTSAQAEQTPAISDAHVEVAKAGTEGVTEPTPEVVEARVPVIEEVNKEEGKEQRKEVVGVVETMPEAVTDRGEAKEYYNPSTSDSVPEPIAASKDIIDTPKIEEVIEQPKEVVAEDIPATESLSEPTSVIVDDSAPQQTPLPPSADVSGTSVAEVSGAEGKEIEETMPEGLNKKQKRDWLKAKKQRDMERETVRFLKSIEGTEGYIASPNARPMSESADVGEGFKGLGRRGVEGGEEGGSEEQSKEIVEPPSEEPGTIVVDATSPAPEANTGAAPEEKVEASEGAPETHPGSTDDSPPPPSENTDPVSGEKTDFIEGASEAQRESARAEPTPDGGSSESAPTAPTENIEPAPEVPSESPEAAPDAQPDSTTSEPSGTDIPIEEEMPKGLNKKQKKAWQKKQDEARIQRELVAAAAEADKVEPVSEVIPETTAPTVVEQSTKVVEPVIDSVIEPASEAAIVEEPSKDIDQPIPEVSSEKPSTEEPATIVVEAPTPAPEGGIKNLEDAIKVIHENVEATALPDPQLTETPTGVMETPGGQSSSEVQTEEEMPKGLNKKQKKAWLKKQEEARIQRELDAATAQAAKIESEATIVPTETSEPVAEEQSKEIIDRVAEPAIVSEESTEIVDLITEPPTSEEPIQVVVDAPEPQPEAGITNLDDAVKTIHENVEDTTTPAVDVSDNAAQSSSEVQTGEEMPKGLNKKQKKAWQKKQDEARIQRELDAAAAEAAKVESEATIVPVEVSEPVAEEQSKEVVDRVSEPAIVSEESTEIVDLITEPPTSEEPIQVVVDAPEPQPEAGISTLDDAVRTIHENVEDTTTPAVDVSDNAAQSSSEVYTEEEMPKGLNKKQKKVWLKRQDEARIQRELNAAAAEAAKVESEATIVPDEVVEETSKNIAEPAPEVVSNSVVIEDVSKELADPALEIISDPVVVEASSENIGEPVSEPAVVEEPASEIIETPVETPIDVGDTPVVVSDEPPKKMNKREKKAWDKAQREAKALAEAEAEAAALAAASDPIPVVSEEFVVPEVLPTPVFEDESGAFATAPMETPIPTPLEEEKAMDSPPEGDAVSLSIEDAAALAASDPEAAPGDVSLSIEDAAALAGDIPTRKLSKKEKKALEKAQRAKELELESSTGTETEGRVAVPIDAFKDIQKVQQNPDAGDVVEDEWGTPALATPMEVPSMVTPDTATPLETPAEENEVSLGGKKKKKKKGKGKAADVVEPESLPETPSAEPSTETIEESVSKEIDAVPETVIDPVAETLALLGDISRSRATPAVDVQPSIESSEQNIESPTDDDDAFHSAAEDRGRSETPTGTIGTIDDDEFKDFHSTNGDDFHSPINGHHAEPEIVSEVPPPLMEDIKQPEAATEEDFVPIGGKKKKKKKKGKGTATDSGEVSGNVSGTVTPGGETEKESFLANAGTLGAGVGAATVLIEGREETRDIYEGQGLNADAAGRWESQPSDVMKMVEEGKIGEDKSEGTVVGHDDGMDVLAGVMFERRKEEDPVAETMKLLEGIDRQPKLMDILNDPEIKEREMLPSVDPQFGDLLPLPPRDSPPNEEVDSGALATSLPLTPVVEQQAVFQPMTLGGIQEQNEPRERTEEVFEIDPEIQERKIHPSVDPQYGDLLPLPPSQPGSPARSLDEEILATTLPDSPPESPVNSRLSIDSSSPQTPRKKDTTHLMRSPSISAVPLKFLLGNRSTLSSPVVGQGSPILTSPTRSEFTERPKSRHSWDSSKGLQPLQLLERRHSRGSSVADFDSRALAPLLETGQGQHDRSPERAIVSDDHAVLTDDGNISTPAEAFATAVSEKAGDEYFGSAAEETSSPALTEDVPTPIEAPSADIADTTVMPPVVDAILQPLQETPLVSSTDSATESATWTEEEMPKGLNAKARKAWKAKQKKAKETFDAEQLALKAANVEMKTEPAIAALIKGGEVPLRAPAQQAVEEKSRDVVDAPLETVSVDMVDAPSKESVAQEVPLPETPMESSSGSAVEWVEEPMPSGLNAKGRKAWKARQKKAKDIFDAEQLAKTTVTVETETEPEGIKEVMKSESVLETPSEEVDTSAEVPVKATQDMETVGQPQSIVEDVVAEPSSMEPLAEIPAESDNIVDTLEPSIARNIPLPGPSGTATPVESTEVETDAGGNKKKKKKGKKGVTVGVEPETIAESAPLENVDNAKEVADILDEKNIDASAEVIQESEIIVQPVAVIDDTPAFAPPADTPIEADVAIDNFEPSIARNIILPESSSATPMESSTESPFVEEEMPTGLNTKQRKAWKKKQEKMKADWETGLMSASAGDSGMQTPAVVEAVAEPETVIPVSDKSQDLPSGVVVDGSGEQSLMPAIDVTELPFFSEQPATVTPDLESVLQQTPAIEPVIETSALHTAPIEEVVQSSIIEPLGSPAPLPEDARLITASTIEETTPLAQDSPSPGHIEPIEEEMPKGLNKKQQKAWKKKQADRLASASASAPDSGVQTPAIVEPEVVVPLSEQSQEVDKEVEEPTVDTSLSPPQEDIDVKATPQLEIGGFIETPAAELSEPMLADRHVEEMMKEVVQDTATPLEVVEEEMPKGLNKKQKKAWEKKQEKLREERASAAANTQASGLQTPAVVEETPQPAIPERGIHTTAVHEPISDPAVLEVAQPDAPSDAIINTTFDPPTSMEPSIEQPIAAEAPLPEPTLETPLETPAETESSAFEPTSSKKSKTKKGKKALLPWEDEPVSAPSGEMTADEMQANMDADKAAQIESVAEDFAPQSDVVDMPIIQPVEVVEPSTEAEISRDLPAETAIEEVPVASQDAAVEIPLPESTLATPLETTEAESSSTIESASAKKLKKKKKGKKGAASESEPATPLPEVKEETPRALDIVDVPAEEHIEVPTDGHVTINEPVLHDTVVEVEHLSTPPNAEHVDVVVDIAELPPAIISPPNEPITEENSEDTSQSATAPQISISINESAAGSSDRTPDPETLVESTVVEEAVIEEVPENTEPPKTAFLEHSASGKGSISQQLEMEGLVSETGAGEAKNSGSESQDIEVVEETKEEEEEVMPKGLNKKQKKAWEKAAGKRRVERELAAADKKALEEAAEKEIEQIVAVPVVESGEVQREMEEEMPKMERKLSKKEQKAVDKKRREEEDQAEYEAKQRQYEIAEEEAIVEAPVTPVEQTSRKIVENPTMESAKTIEETAIEDEWAPTRKLSKKEKKALDKKRKEADEQALLMAATAAVTVSAASAAAELLTKDEELPSPKEIEQQSPTTPVEEIIPVETQAIPEAAKDTPLQVTSRDTMGEPSSESRTDSDSPPANTKAKRRDKGKGKAIESPDASSDKGSVLTPVDTIRPPGEQDGSSRTGNDTPVTAIFHARSSSPASGIFQQALEKVVEKQVQQRDLQENITKEAVKGSWSFSSLADEEKPDAPWSASRLPPVLEEDALLEQPRTPTSPTRARSPVQRSYKQQDSGYVPAAEESSKARPRSWFDPEYVRDSGVQLREKRSSDSQRSLEEQATTDDVLTRRSWPPVDEDRETVDLRRKKRSSLKESQSSPYEKITPGEIAKAATGLGIAGASKRSLSKSPALSESPSREFLLRKANRSQTPSSDEKGNNSSSSSRVPIALRGVDRSETPRSASDRQHQRRSSLLESLHHDRTDSPRSFSDQIHNPRTRTPRTPQEREEYYTRGATPTLSERGLGLSRPTSVISNRSVTPSLRRVSGRASSDLRALSQSDLQAQQSQQSQQSKEVGAKEDAKSQPRDSDSGSASDKKPSPAGSDVNKSSTDISASGPPNANEGRQRIKGMAEVYNGFGEGRMGSPRSPTRPHSMRRKQSMQLLDMQAQMAAMAEELAAARQEKAVILQAKEAAERNLDEARREAGKAQSYKAQAEEVRGLLESMTLKNTDLRRQTLDLQTQLELRDNGAEAAIAAAVAAAIASKEEEVAQLRARAERLSHDWSGDEREIEELETIIANQKQEIATLRQSQATGSDYLAEFHKDDTHFEQSCQLLFRGVWRWVHAFSDRRKHSDISLDDIKALPDQRIYSWLRNAFVGNLEAYLSDLDKRRLILMSLTMALFHHYIFSKHFFGLDGKQEAASKVLEKIVKSGISDSEFRTWRATQFCLFSKSDSYTSQRNDEVLDVTQSVLDKLSSVLPQPSTSESDEDITMTVVEELTIIVKKAAELSNDMRRQRSRYVWQQSPKALWGSPRSKNPERFIAGSMTHAEICVQFIELRRVDEKLCDRSIAERVRARLNRERKQHLETLERDFHVISKEEAEVPGFRLSWEEMLRRMEEKNRRIQEKCMEVGLTLFPMVIREGDVAGRGMEKQIIWKAVVRPVDIKKPTTGGKRGTSDMGSTVGSERGGKQARVR